MYEARGMRHPVETAKMRRTGWRGPPRALKGTARPAEGQRAPDDGGLPSGAVYFRLPVTHDGVLMIGLYRRRNAMMTARRGSS